MTLPRWFSVAALYALQNSMMLTPCCPSAGPTGGAGLACPATIWSLISPVTFFFFGAMRCRLFLPGVLNLGDLAESQFHWCFAAEDRHQHLELLLFGVDLVDRGRQRGKRSVHDRYRLAHLVIDLNDRTLQPTRLGSGGGGRRTFAGLLRRPRRQQELHHIVQRESRRIRRRADEPGDPRGVAHRGARVVGQI